MFMPSVIAKSVDQVARRIAGKDWNLYAALLDHWPELVGNDYARMTAPVKVTFPHQPQETKRCNGTLCIRLPKGLVMEFSFRIDVIRQRINTYFGYEAIGRIIFDAVHKISPQSHEAVPADPSSIAHMRDTAQAIENDDVRTALESFGEAILNRQACENAQSRFSKPG